MKVLSRKRQYDIDINNLTELIGGRFPVHIDVGTGSGRLVLVNAKRDSTGFYIGMDPSAESMGENSIKAAKQAKMKACENLLFVVASIEALPNELERIADNISVILPWGSLLDGIVKAEPLVMENLRRLGKRDARLSILVGYDEREAGEIAKRSLPTLSCDYLDKLRRLYHYSGIKVNELMAIGNNELKLIESDWAKKLAYGVPRKMYRLECTYI